MNDREMIEHDEELRKLLRRWEAPEPGKASIEAFFTSKGNDVYAILPRWPGRTFAVSDLTGGEPEMQECDDPIQCCDPRCDGQWHPCAACNGTGLAKHQVIW